MPVAPIASLIEDGLASSPERVVLVSRHARFSMADLAEEVYRATGALASLGVHRGDRVAGCVRNHSELVVAFLAAMHIGAIWVGVNPVLAAAERSWLLADSGASVLIGETAAIEGTSITMQRCPELRHLVTVQPGLDCEWRDLLRWSEPLTGPVDPVDTLAPAAIAYTSGTSGRPKGVVHSQHNLVVVASGAGGRTVPGPGDRVGVCLPASLLNLMVLGPLTALAREATCVLVDRVDPVGLAEWIIREHITTMSLVPTILYDLVTSPEVDTGGFSSTFQPTLGGSDCPPRWRALFQNNGFRASQNYGLTEAPTSVTAGVPEQPFGSSGRALPHVSITIRDSESGEPLPPGQVGEICVGPAVRGPYAGIYRTMLGYWQRPNESEQALAQGVLHTGDLGWLDHDGWLFVADRRHDLILRGGANVYPAEVERVLVADSRVRAAAVVGIPDDRLGQRVYAAVELNDAVADTGDAAAATGEALRHHCFELLARYKVPDRIVVVDRLPRTSMGKVRRREVLELLSADPIDRDRRR